MSGKILHVFNVANAPEIHLDERNKTFSKFYHQRGTGLILTREHAFMVKWYKSVV